MRAPYGAAGPPCLLRGGPVEFSVFCERIGLSPASAQAAAAYPLSPDQNRRLARRLMDGDPGFESEAGTYPDPPLLMLSLIIRLAIEAHSVYAERQIPDRVYWATFSDIALWACDYEKAAGRPGLTEWRWLSLHAALRLFRLGRLQFEPIRLAETVRTDTRLFAAGTPALGVHIPADGRLDPDETAKSYAAAAVFFNRPEPLFHCASWLLGPDLDGLLPASSRIRQFAGEYRIYRVDETSRQAEERIFGFVSDQPSLYPDRTSLQKAARAHLLRGGRLPAGCGLRF